MSKRINYKVLNNINCKNCKKIAEKRTHKEITEKHLKQPYYFKEWDYCRNCKHVQHYEDMKVWNNNNKGKDLRNYEERQRQEKHLSEIE